MQPAATAVHGLTRPEGERRSKISGAWEASADGLKWRHDLHLIYARPGDQERTDRVGNMLDAERSRVTSQSSPFARAVTLVSRDVIWSPTDQFSGKTSGSCSSGVVADPPETPPPPLTVSVVTSLVFAVALRVS